MGKNLGLLVAVILPKLPTVLTSQGFQEILNSPGVNPRALPDVAEERPTASILHEQQNIVLFLEVVIQLHYALVNSLNPLLDGIQYWKNHEILEESES